MNRHHNAFHRNYIQSYLVQRNRDLSEPSPKEEIFPGANSINVFPILDILDYMDTYRIENSIAFYILFSDVIRTAKHASKLLVALPSTC